MKKYIILTPNVCGMGGAELYTLRRCNHLKNRNFDIHVVVAYHKDYFPLKDKFVGIPIHIFPELEQYPSGYSKEHQDLFLKRLLNEVGRYGDVYIESHTLFAIVWGELLAQECHAKHLAYPLTEHKLKTYRFKPGRDIFKYKLENNEFYGCFSSALNIIFDSDEVPNNFVNIGFDETELVEFSVPSLNIIRSDDDYVITTVGRLDKVYIEPFIANTLDFIQKHPQQKFILIIGGGSQKEGCEENLREKYIKQSRNIENLKIVFTSYIDVLGKDIFRISDVFVGLGTATINSISQGCLTINVDPSSKNMDRVSGFFGTDTQNFAYSDNGMLYTLKEKLEEALTATPQKRQALRHAGRKTFEERFSLNICMEKLDKAIETIQPYRDNFLLKVPFWYRYYVRFGLALHNIVKKI